MMQENENYNLGVRPDIGEMFAAGIAYVIIPPDVSRDKYIRECYKTSTVSIFSEFNGVSNRVHVDTFTLSFIQFPEVKEQMGSAVSFLLDPVHKKPIIVGLFNKTDQLSDLKEHQFKFSRELNGNFVELSGSPKSKNLAIGVSADEGGEVSINVKSRDNSGNVQINVDGNCNVTSTNDTTLKQHGKLTLITENINDEEELTFEEHTSTGRHIMSREEKLDTDKLIINEGKENFVLGQKLKAFLDSFITEVGKTTVTTSMGRMPILNKVQVEQFKKKTDELLSEIAFIDK
jgi:Fe-S cluster biogenesis protein NfuA